MWRTQCKRELLFQPLLSFAPCGPYLGALSCAWLTGSGKQATAACTDYPFVPLYWYKKLENSWSCSLELYQTKRWLQLRVSRTCLPPACCVGVGTTCRSLEGRFLVCRLWAGDPSSCCTGYSYWLNASAQCGGSWGILGWIKHKFHSFLLIREFEG